MELKPKVLAAVYFVTAILALVLTWWHLPEYSGSGFIEANKLFWKDALFNSHAAGRFLVIDLLFLAFVCNVWILLEGRRLKMRFLYAYIIGGIVVAISVTFPLFMAVRTLKLAQAGEDGGSGASGEQNQLSLLDFIALVFLFGTTLAAGIMMM